MKTGQQGAALLVVIALVAVTVPLVLSGLERILLANRIAAAGHERMQAFAAAESALHIAAREAPERAVAPLMPDPAGDRAAWRAHLRSRGTAVRLPGRKGDAPVPRVLVERIATGYRITSLGVGRRGQPAVILQAVHTAGSSARIWRELR